eukprot:Phypoly_transcript_01215.p1 GENE.Phypoly_transcript_01215~~Phypoly_transcript_01215.p1  ORF type:complete len:695 (+),score=95.64 Phypoly_transcript_01215:179-2263(+)
MEENGLGLESLNKARAKAQSLSFNVSVTALMKSGKSTLIDAILGDEILPWGDLPETTRVVRIIHKPELKIPRLLFEEKVLAEGAQNICLQLKSHNSKGRDAPATVLDEELVVEAPIIALEGTPFSDVEFHLLDTPGPNEARADILKHQVSSILQNSDVIIYLLDYTSLGSDDEQKFFENLFSLKKELLIECFRRIFFVVTKIDMHSQRAPPLEDIPKTIVNLILKLCPAESRDQIAISENQVLMLNAKEALLARQVAGVNPPEDIQKAYSKVVFGKKWQNQALDKLRAEVPSSLIDSHMIAFEERVLTYMRQNSWMIYLEAVYHLLHPCVVELNNFLATSMSALAMNSAQLAQRTESLLRKIQEIQGKFTAVEAETDQLTNQVIQQIHSESDAVRINFQSNIKLACSSDKEVNSDITRIRKLLKETTSSDKSNVSDTITEVNLALSKLLQDEFACSRIKLESIATASLHELHKTLQNHVQPLVAEVEATVKQHITLNLPLHDFRLELIPPSESDLHRSVTNLAGFIQDNKVMDFVEVKVEKKACTRRWYEWERKRVEVHNYSINKQDLIQSWCGEAERLSALLSELATEMARRHCAAIVRQAKSELDRYSQMLMDAADCARKTHNQGEEATREKVGYFAACAVATCKIMVSLAEIKQQITVGYKGTAPGVQPPTNLPLNNLHVEGAAPVNSTAN